ncbi:hypothetical protein CYMTET_26321 [Cymbomonas tetramitiformis]|uniref:Uncharacterized protein n=1 Tax=Cymbomonas tetramitiformis TaxID=36881 RepID=A0AAE0FSB7_9CHLO|nr:hypothetical protein CYMTET_26321 [Cymbomonas tetramitiformis]
MPSKARLPILAGLCVVTIRVLLLGEEQITYSRSIEEEINDSTSPPKPIARGHPTAGRRGSSPGGHSGGSKKKSMEVPEVELELDDGEEPADNDLALPKNKWPALLHPPQDIIMSRERLVNRSVLWQGTVDGERVSESHLLFAFPDPRNQDGQEKRLIHIEPEFLPVIPNSDLIRGSRFKSCAVVGNSGTLKNSRQGDAIDEHDIVIRINYAPIVGFERDVGRKVL